MKKGHGLSGYNAYRIECTANLKEPGSASRRISLQEAITQVMPVNDGGRWLTGSDRLSWYITGERGGTPQETYHKLTQAIWKSLGRYCPIYLDARPIVVEESIYFCSEEKDYKA